MYPPVFGVFEATLAAVFLLAGAGKLADRDGVRRAAVDFGVPKRLAQNTTILPWLELLTGVSFFSDRSARWAAIAATLFLLAFTVLISLNLARGRRPACHCFGRINSKPIGWSTLGRNIGLLGCGITVASRTGLPGLWTWVIGLDYAARWIILAASSGAAVIGTAGFCFLHLLRQNGRLLLRVQVLEKQMAMITGSDAGNSEMMAGLPLESPAPQFEAMSGRGEIISLASLLAINRPVLLLFTDPHCGACQELYPDITRWQQEHESTITAVVISSPGTTAGRGGEPPRNLLLQKDREILNLYNCTKLPGAVLVNTRGRIASPMAVGPQEIREMVRIILANPSHLAQIGGANGASHTGSLGIGDHAPPLEALTQNGPSVSVSSLRSRPVMLLFWNPQCSFCVRMSDRLKQWYLDPPPTSPHLVLISSYPAERTFDMGLRWPIVADLDSSIRRAFGVKGTPSAVLLDGAGKIASSVAVGSEMVLALAGMR